MIAIDAIAYEAVRGELLSGESILWAGRPEKRVVFHREDAKLIPFSLLWGGFAIFWEGGVLGYWGFSQGKASPGFFVLWGIPFVVMGQYLIWGRFLAAAWKKSRTWYALTERRALVVHKGWSSRITSSSLGSVSILTLEVGSGTTGTLRFGPSLEFGRSTKWGAWDGMGVGDTPVFRDIEGVREVYRLALELKEKVQRT